MAAMNNISELKPFKSMWKVKVKIIRLWKQYSAAGGETIEMVFVDSRVSPYTGFTLLKTYVNCCIDLGFLLFYVHF